MPVLVHLERVREDEMADLLFVLLLAGLFAVTAGAVRFCDRRGSAEA